MLLPVPSYLRRSAAMLYMPDAITRGLSVSGFIKELKSMGLSYRRTLMLSDWHNIEGTEKRKDVVKYVRRDRLLSIHAMADVDWEMKHKYMYKFGVWMENEPLEKKAKMGVNIVSDKPLTPAQAEALFWERWKDVERYGTAAPAQVKLVGAWRRIPSLEEPTPSPFLEEAERG